MKLIVGLGNPGPEYAKTRHNAGFLALDGLASRLAATFAEKKGLKGEVAEAPEVGIALLKPSTFMNLSGESVAAAVRKWNLSPADILVIHDEADIPFGEVRSKDGGGTAGHNGLKSIKEHLPAGAEFARIRIGVGRDPAGRMPLDEWVLAKWTKEEAAALPDLVSDAADRAREWYG